MGGQGQLGAHLIAVIGFPIAERTGPNEERHMPAAHPLASQLLGSPLHVASQRLVHRANLSDALAEGTGTDDLLLGLGQLFQLGAGDPPRSSCTVRSTTTPYRRRRLLGSAATSSATVLMPCSLSLVRVLVGAMPDGLGHRPTHPDRQDPPYSARHPR